MMNDVKETRFENLKGRENIGEKKEKGKKRRKVR